MTNPFRVLSCMLLLCTQQVMAQPDYTWWNELVNWDGFTPWPHYVTWSPGRLGPNALPVPFHYKGQVGTELEIESRLEYNGGFGDNSISVFSRVYWPVVPKLIAVELYMVPFQRYSVTEDLRDERQWRNYELSGVAVGDIYFNTLVQAIRDHKFLPDLLVGVHLKTASGDMREAGRSTDTPAYWFDLSFGKSHQISKNGDWKLRWYGMFGFYVWQTYEEPQNDAWLYGLGIDLSWKSLTLEQDLSGYTGYQRNGDSPLVYRLYISQRWGRISLKAGYGYGIQDFPFHTLRLGLTYHLDLSKEGGTTGE